MLNNILVCDDDTAIVDSIEIYLQQEGYHVIKAYDGVQALEVLHKEEIQLVIIDVMMPRLDGIRAILKIREESNMPIIVLSAKTADSDKILGLNVGADDYVSKPFNPLELVARVNSQMRRYTKLGNAAESSKVFQSGGLAINDDLKSVSVDGEAVRLTPIEYNILLLLVKNQGKVFSINQIYENIWNEEAIGADNTVAVHIRHIREKIEINPKDPQYLKVVWGVGYKIEKIEPRESMEQNRKRYSSLAKAIVIGQQMIAAVVASVSIVLFSTCVNQNMLNMGDLQNSSFVESGYFERTFSKQMMQLLDYLNLREAFETSGVFDENRPETVNASPEKIADYKVYNNKYDQNNTNVYYWLGDLRDNTYVTNMKETKTQEDAYDQAVKYGRYLSYNNKTFRFETNIGGMENNYYQNMAQYNELQKGDFSLIVAVDVKFPQEDDLAVAKREFDKLYPWAQRSLVLAAVGIVVWLIGLCYMTVAAAKRSEDKEVHLTNFDKIRTEIPIALLFVFSICLTALGMRVHSQSYGVMSRMVIVGTFAVLADCCFMGMYLSLVRRVKADTFFENSYLHWLLVNLKDTMHNRYLGNRMTLVIWGIVLSNVAIAYLAFHCGYIWAYILLAIFLVFTLIYFSQRVIQRRKILEGIEQITQGKFDYKLNLSEYQGDEYQLAEGINHIGEGLANAIGESVRDERMKANMITNISHDIKTPLTSIINYIGLLRREKIDNPSAESYIKVLESKAMRLKQLMEDLVDVSRISSGNITLQMDDIDLVELVRQTGGEFNEKLEQKGLNVISKFPKEAVMIYADGRQLWRVIGNLYNNTAKYAMPDTRVYAEVAKDGYEATFTMKNISEKLLNVDADTLAERFVRGDESRSTEGSGLGLSISKMLTELMGGKFEIDLEDDLFRVKLTFRCKE